MGEHSMTCDAVVQESHKRSTHSVWERALYENFMVGQQANQTFSS